MSSLHVNFDKSMIGFTSESLPVDICNPGRTSAGGQATSDDVFVGRLRGLHVRLLRVTTMHGQTLSNPLGLNTSKRELAEQNSCRLKIVTNHER